MVAKAAIQRQSEKERKRGISCNALSFLLHLLPSDSEDAGIEPRTIATLQALTARDALTVLPLS
jgi:hypothetical protein